MSKHMRLPNGFGQISKLKQRLRSPYRAMVTLGTDENGKYKRKIIGYYKTYNEAYSALMEYHSAPEYRNKNIKMADLFEMWAKTIEPDKYRYYKYAWDKCGRIYELPVCDVRGYHVKDTVEADMPPSAHPRVHQLLNKLFDYAVEYDMTDKNYSRISKPVYDTGEVNHHITFTVDEIRSAYKNINDEVCALIVIGCYSGLRPNELLSLANENINFDTGIIVTGSKTEAGRDRRIPIHPVIIDLLKERAKAGNIFSIEYDAYRYRLTKAGNHRPHDTRKTFVTLAKKYNVDEYAIKRIVGHVITDITESVYTERGDDWLIEEISKIPAVDLL